MSQIGRDECGLQPKLGLFDATMLVAGSMIGSGIFIVSAVIARDVGSSGWLLLVWVLTGVLTIIGALSYAELASMMPNAGGQYVFLREAYGPLCRRFFMAGPAFSSSRPASSRRSASPSPSISACFVPELGTEHILWNPTNSTSTGKCRCRGGRADVVLQARRLADFRGSTASPWG